MKRMLVSPVLYQLIFNKSRDYFSLESIRTFFERLEPFGTSFQDVFYQINQKNDMLVMEFAGLTDTLLVDLSGTGYKLESHTVPLKTITHLSIKTNNGKATVQVHFAGGAIYWNANTKEDAKKLLEFALKLERRMGGLA